MTLVPTVSDPIIENNGSYEQAKSFQTDLVWKKLNEISVEEAISYWQPTLSPKTSKNYRSGMNKLAEYALIDPFLSLQMFALVNHEAVVDRIKLVEDWSEGTRQARAACYISFTGFLHRRLQGIVKKAIPNREGHAKTFFKVREKVKTSAMSQSQWVLFFQALENINARDCLIAKLLLQGGKRVSEVLNLKTHQIDWDACQITFIQSKMRGVYKETVITYPETIIRKLRSYIGQRQGNVFVTISGKTVLHNQLAVTFARAGKAADIPFKVTPHVLRASNVTYLKQQGFSDSDIMRVTGHSSSAMIYAYDKAALSENASKKVTLIS